MHDGVDHFTKFNNSYKCMSKKVGSGSVNPDPTKPEGSDPTRSGSPNTENCATRCRGGREKRNLMRAPEHLEDMRSSFRHVVRQNAWGRGGGEGGGGAGVLVLPPGGPARLC